MLAQSLQLRDWYLTQLGITQYTLRHSTLLNTDVLIHITPEIQLLIITQHPPDLSHTLFDDVLQTMQLTPNEVLVINPEQSYMLLEQLSLIVWIMGELPVEKCPKTDHKQIITPDFEHIHQSASAKKQLWQAIWQ